MYTRICFICITMFSATNMTMAQDQAWNVVKLGEWNLSNPILDSINDFHYTDVWGYAKDGREYAFIGSYLGYHAIDVTDPIHPVEVDAVYHSYTGREYYNSGMDLKVNGDYLYTTYTRYNGVLEVHDLRSLPDSMTLVYSSDSLVSFGHNITIDADSKRLYVSDSRSDSHPLPYSIDILSIDQPGLPVRLKSIPPDSLFPGMELSSHDMYVNHDTAYVHFGNSGLHIIDFSNLSDIKSLGTLEFYPFKGYCHSGWLHNNGQTYVMADETMGTHLKVLDVSDPTDIRVSSTFGVDTVLNHTPHNPVILNDHTLVSYYASGLQIYDIHDPAHPFRSGYYVPANANTWGVYPFLPSGNILISDQNGLFILNIDAALTSIPKIESMKETVSISPNPSTDKAVIRWPGDHKGPITLNIYDPQGRRIQHTTGIQTHSFTLDLSGLDPGMYIVELVGTAFRATAKLARN